jgi:hypothetical protein
MDDSTFLQERKIKSIGPSWIVRTSLPVQYPFSAMGRPIGDSRGKRWHVRQRLGVQQRV